jgi:hypothetical protein
MKQYQLTIALCPVFLAPVTVLAQTQPHGNEPDRKPYLPKKLREVSRENC